MSVQFTGDRKGLSSLEVSAPQTYFVSTGEMETIFKSFDDGQGVNPHNIVDGIVERYLAQQGIVKEDILGSEGSLWDFQDFDEIKKILKIKIFFPYYQNGITNDFRKTLYIFAG